MSAVAFADRYHVERPLGRGGMARVDLARDVDLDRLVAVKVLADNLAGDAELRERFVREGRLAARLAHPNVVGVLDAGEVDGLPFIVMEYVDGETLADVVRREGALPWDRAVGLALQALDGIEHAHAAGLVHRDVKPANLLLRRDGQLKIGDFGIARAVELSGLTEAGTILGTAAYLAPEQARGEEVGPAADVYGLASVLYELLTGRPPRRVASLGELVDAVHTPIPPVRDLAPDVPEPVEEAVMSGLAARADARPTAAGLRAALTLPETPTASEQATTILRPGRRRRARRLAPWLVVALATAAIAVAGFLALDGDPAPAEEPRQTQPAPRGPQAGATPEETARNLSEWLRANARGGTG
jgi:eukaryotic-like serine/threonine-protein kinase